MEHEERLRVVEQVISTHEAVCAERYQGIIQTHVDIKADITDVKSKMDKRDALLIKMGIALLGGMAIIIFNTILLHR